MAIKITVVKAHLMGVGLTRPMWDGIIRPMLLRKPPFDLTKDDDLDSDNAMIELEPYVRALIDLDASTFAPAWLAYVTGSGYRTWPLISEIVDKCKAFLPVFYGSGNGCKLRDWRNEQKNWQATPAQINFAIRFSKANFKSSAWYDWSWLQPFRDAKEADDRAVHRAFINSRPPLEPYWRNLVDKAVQGRSESLLAQIILRKVGKTY